MAEKRSLKQIKDVVEKLLGMEFNETVAGGRTPITYEGFLSFEGLKTPKAHIILTSAVNPHAEGVYCLQIKSFNKENLKYEVFQIPHKSVNSHSESVIILATDDDYILMKRVERLFTMIVGLLNEDFLELSELLRFAIKAQDQIVSKII